VVALEQPQPYATAADTGSERTELGGRIYRHVNERIRELSRLYDFGEPFQMFCECGARVCTARIAIDPRRYEEIRVFATRFLVAPGHTGPGDTVVERTAGHWVVDVDPPAPQEQER
jgi:hypothetical protein